MAAESRDSFQEKTEAPTPKRREDSRRKGKVAKSVEMNSALLLVFGLMILSFGGKALAAQLGATMRSIFSNAASYEINAVNTHLFFTQGIGTIGMILGPVVLALMLVSLLSSYAQVGFLFTLEPLQPKWKKLNPLTGIKKVFGSRRSFVELTKNLIKISLVGVIGYFAVDGVLVNAIDLMDDEPASVLAAMGTMAMGVGLKVGLAFFALAVLDFLYQRYEYEQDLKMTKQEVKDEGKMMEGDPLIKGRIRGIQRQIAYRRMMQDVPRADVVVTNPTHYAVAIQYDAGTMNAPTVVAKGADLVAMKIKEIATAHGVPIVEDRILAKTLYQSVDVGEQIPEKLFQAVAQILAYIYRLRQERQAFSH